MMMMKYNYRVRVLCDSSLKFHEVEISNLSYSDAVEKFIFYVTAALELGVSIRCVNIFLGKKCIKLFTNH